MKSLKITFFPLVPEFCLSLFSYSLAAYDVKILFIFLRTAQVLSSKHEHC